MIKRRILACMTLTLISSQTVLAKSKHIPGPGHHFIVTVPAASSVATITTTTPHWTYPQAGIKVLSGNYTVSGGTPSPNGYTLFSVSDTVPAHITFSGPIGQASVRLCLNGVGKTYTCEDYTLSITTSHVIFVTSVGNYTGDLGGTPGADAICQSVAAAAGNSIVANLSSSFKALIVTPSVTLGPTTYPSRFPCSGGATGSCGGSFASNWPLVAGAQYVYPDGVTVFNTVNSNGVFDGSNRNLNDENNNQSFNFFWSGIQSVLTNSTATDIAGWAYDDMNPSADSVNYNNYLSTCNGFTSASGVTPTFGGSFGASGVPITSGLTSSSGLTWGNYYTFSDGGYEQISNLFSVSGYFSCSYPLALVCVS